MSLKKCEECGHQVSDKANTCPSCGAPQYPKQHEGGAPSDTDQKPGIIKWGKLIALVFMGIIIISYFAEDKKKVTPAWPGKPATHVWNAKAANSADVQQAKDFLSDLPSACGDSTAKASDDGTVTIHVKCSNGERFTEKEIAIKDGIVKNIR